MPVRSVTIKLMAKHDINQWYIYIYIYIQLYTYIYIYISVIHIYIYIYIYIYINPINSHSSTIFGCWSPSILVHQEEEPWAEREEHEGAMGHSASQEARCAMAWWNGYPLVMSKIAIENGHRNSGFTRWTWWFSIVMLVYQRVYKWRILNGN